MSTDAEQRLETIASGIVFKFEKIASEICDEAQIEDADRPYKFREWGFLLEQRCRSLTADGKTTDEDAALVAVALFNPKSFAKRLRGGWKGLLHRILFYKNYASYRLFSPLLFAIYHNSVRSVHYKKELTLANESINWHFYIEDWNRNIGVTTLILMLFWRGLYRVVDVPQFFIPVSQTRTISGEKPKLKMNPIRLYFESVVFFMFIELYTAVVYEQAATIGNMFFEYGAGLLRRNYFFGSQELYLTVFGMFYLVDAVAMFVVLALAAAEVFDLPARRRAKIEWRNSKILSVQ